MLVKVNKGLYILEKYTVSFFGHRCIEQAAEIEVRLNKLLYDIMEQKDLIDFLMGRDGDFDLLAASAVKRAVDSYGHSGTKLTLVLPYMKGEYPGNEQSYREYYDSIEVCSESAGVHPKSAKQLRNRCIVNRSDLVICCIQHKSGRAYSTVHYAEKQQKKVINLADEKLIRSQE